MEIGCMFEGLLDSPVQQLKSVLLIPDIGFFFLYLLGSLWLLGGGEEIFNQGIGLCFKYFELILISNFTYLDFLILCKPIIS